MAKYPPLPDHLANQLTQIEPSAEPYCNLKYYPCAVELEDGRTLDCVYFAEADAWFQLWGVWPDEDSGKMAVDVREVALVRESPFRLPVRFANQLYEAGESGMGYTIFTVQFADGSKRAYGTGNAIDFIEYPEGQSKDTVTGIFPHLGRNDPDLRSAPGYYWCLFGRAST